MRRSIFALLLGISALPVSAATPEQARWAAQAARVTITRDDWGIAHVHGRSDADAVFGAIYAQAEDDFPRIEANYLTALGRTAEAEGEVAIWADLRQRLYIDPVRLRADYAKSPPWLRALMQAWADGLNFYLARHPDVHPRVITRFEPWMALSFTEGSIGGDIERIDPKALRAFYDRLAPALATLTRHPREGGDPSMLSTQIAASGSMDWLRRPDGSRLRGNEGEEGGRLASLIHDDKEPRGSNGIAIGPKRTRDGHAMLLINPHTSFFFRSELGMESDAGLHAYGASTWGQFFLYQGWNEHLGWMHTSSGVDSVDEFVETIATKGTAITYRYGAAQRPVRTVPITIRYRQPDGTQAARTFTTYATHHGPIVRGDGAKWMAFALMNKPIPALEQSWLRTRATNLARYLEVAKLQANSSNDTIYADAAGNIAYLHPQFVPKRDDRFDYRDPQDGSDPATDWRGLTPLDQLPHLLNPATGWLYNSNNSPWTAAGPMSQHAGDFPRYMDEAGENPRGVHAVRLLSQAKALTPEGLIKLAFDPSLPAFDPMLFKLFEAYDRLPAADPARARLADPIAMLRGWDKKWAAESEPTSLAVFFGEALWTKGEKSARTAKQPVWDWMSARATPSQYLDALGEAADRLTRDWGSIRVKWSEINRFQRNDAAIVQTFSDDKPSIPVPFASARWGSLASFGAKAYPGTKRWYGTSGNSFVAVVEFGPKVRAWAVTAGGESGHPDSPHFTDEATRYASGNLRPVYFYAADLVGHVERRYRPGE
jgi:acyl-homoserine-lactone acylase